MRYALLFLLLLPIQIYAQSDWISFDDPIQPYAARQMGDSVVLERDSMRFVIQHRPMSAFHLRFLLHLDSAYCTIILKDIPFCYMDEQAHQAAWRQGFIDLLAAGRIPAKMFWNPYLEPEWQQYASAMVQFGGWNEGESQWRTIDIHDLHVLDTPDDALKCIVFCPEPIFRFSNVGRSCFGLLVEAIPKADGLPRPSREWRIVCMKRLWIEI